jgi:hypothetical protein
MAMNTEQLKMLNFICTLHYTSLHTGEQHSRRTTALSKHPQPKAQKQMTPAEASTQGLDWRDTPEADKVR